MKFTGTVEDLGSIDERDARQWIQAISLKEWPQQNRLADGLLRPAMVNNTNWLGFGLRTDGLVRQLRRLVPEGVVFGQRMLSVVMPGHSIDPHVDIQASNWLGRVHVPLVTDLASIFTVDGVDFYMEVGRAYLVNTEREHSVSNLRGVTPRIHFMVDFESI